MYVCVCVYTALIGYAEQTTTIMLNQTRERELDIYFEGVSLNDELFLHCKTLTIQLKFTSWIKRKKKKNIESCNFAALSSKGPHNPSQKERGAKLPQNRN